MTSLKLVHARPGFAAVIIASLFAQPVSAANHTVDNLALDVFPLMSSGIEVSHDGHSYDHYNANSFDIGVLPKVKCNWNRTHRSTHIAFGSLSAPGGVLKASGAQYYKQNVLAAVQDKGPDEGVSPWVFNIPVNKISGNGVNEVDGIALCNAELQKWVNAGKNAEDFLEKDNHIVVSRTLSLAASCSMNGIEEVSSGYATLNRKTGVAVICKAGAAKPARPGSDSQVGKDKVIAPEIVDNKLTNLTPNYHGSCPAQLKFRGVIETNRPGLPVKYRIVRSDGTKSGFKHIRLAENQKKLVFNFTGSVEQVTDIGEIKSSGNNLKMGWFAVEAHLPEKVASNKASYSIRCRDKKSASSTLAQAPKKDQPQLKVIKASSFRLTGIQASAKNNGRYKGMCPSRIELDAVFTATGKGQVKYRIKGPDGYRSAVKTVAFTKSGKSTRVTTHKVQIKNSGQHGYSIETLNANGMVSKRMVIHAQCGGLISAPGTKLKPITAALAQ